MQRWGSDYLKRYVEALCRAHLMSAYLPLVIPYPNNKCVQSAIANAIPHVRLPYRQVSVQVGLQIHKSWIFPKDCSLRHRHIVYPCPGI